MAEADFQILDWGGRKLVWVESSRVDACLRFCREKQLDGIALGGQHYHGPNIEFLREHPDLTGVVIPTAANWPIAPLKNLTALKLLSVSGTREPLDLSDFPDLEEAQLEWHPKLTLPQHGEKLRVLSLRKYKPRTGDLRLLPSLGGLEDLAIVQSPVASLNGIERFSSLVRLELAYLPKLESLRPLAVLRDVGLRELECQNCPKLRDHQALREVHTLRAAKFNRCGPIESLGFIEDMASLSEFRFIGTDVADGNMLPLTKLEAFAFTAKKHFSHTPEQLEAMMA